MTRFPFPLATLALLAGILPPLSAQSAVVSRHDTLGANFDVTKPGTASPNDFDFLVGTWSYRYQARVPQTGAYTPVFTGLWTAIKSRDGAMIEDDFVTAGSDGKPRHIMTYRVYDHASRRWSIQGVDLSRGVWQPGHVWTVGKERFLVQDNPAVQLAPGAPEVAVKLRIRYYSIGSDRFLWRADGSLDGGSTWTRDVMLIEATRVKSQ